MKQNVAQADSDIREPVRGGKGEKVKGKKVKGKKVKGKGRGTPPLHLSPFTLSPFTLYLLPFTLYLFPLTLFSQSFDEYFLESLRYKHKGDPAGAFESLQNALKIDSTSSAALYEISHYYLFLNQENKALDALQKAVSYAPKNLEYKRLLAGLSKELQHNNEAIALYEELANAKPQNPEWAYNLAGLYLQQKQIEKAVESFNLLKMMGIDEPWEDTLPVWIKILQEAVKEENPDEIIRICEAALEYFPDTPEFYLYSGSAYYIKKEYDTALSVYLSGIEHTPADKLSFLSAFAGQTGDLYYLSEQKAKAYEYYDKALEYNEQNIAVLNNYAYHLALDKADLDKAERMAATAVQMQPNNSTYIDTYAWVFFQKGNYSLAKFYIESAIAKAGQPGGELLEHYGDILLQIGNREKALSEWNKALVLYKETGENTENLERKINAQP
jgi:tetratricopeptide (TPR) repeat protein